MYRLIICYVQLLNIPLSLIIPFDFLLSHTESGCLFYFVIMTDLAKDQFGDALSKLKMKNIDTASLHEIIGEFAPVIGMDTDETNALKHHNTAKSFKAVQLHSEKVDVNLSNGYSKIKQEPASKNLHDALDLSLKQTAPSNSSPDPDRSVDDISHSNTHGEVQTAAETPDLAEEIDPTVVNLMAHKGSNISLPANNSDSILKTDIKQLNDESCSDTLSDSLFEDQDISEKSLKALYEIKTIYDLKYYQCKLCPKIYDTKYHLNRHLISHGGNRPHRCGKCGKSFSQKCDLNRHMNVHNNLRNHACSVCNKSFKRADYLSKHERQYCGVLKPHKCLKCSKGFEDVAQLKEHIRSHNETSFHCEHCSEEFTSVDSLVQHRKIHSKRNEEYTCTKCRQLFTDFSSYVDHFKTHSGDRPYTCDLCQKVFSRNHNLMTHMWIHNQEKQHTCHICAKTFTYYSNLQVHLRVHRNERPYKCDECDKGFLTSSDLRRHKRTHSGEKPYKCTQCLAMYARKERLISHMVTHMEEDMNEREVSRESSSHTNGEISVTEEENSNITDGDVERGEEELMDEDDEIESNGRTRTETKTV